jgi:hypothetical protein
MAAAALLLDPAAAQDGQVFEKPFRLMAGDEFVQVSRGYAVPTLFDIDRDGNRDLVVGEFDQGQIRVFRNTGTGDFPVYSRHEYLAVGGDNVRLPIS